MTTFSSQRQSPDVAQVEQRLLDIFNILGKNIILKNLFLFMRYLWNNSSHTKLNVKSNRKGFDVFKRSYQLSFMSDLRFSGFCIISFYKDFLQDVLGFLNLSLATFAMIWTGSQAQVSFTTWPLIGQ